MATESDGIMQIIATARSLVRQCEQGQTARLRRLTAPLPPLLQNETEELLQGFHALTRFSPFEDIGNQLSDTVQSGDLTADARSRPRPESQGVANAQVSSNVTPPQRKSRQPTAVVDSQPSTRSSVSAMTASMPDAEADTATVSSAAPVAKKSPQAEAQIKQPANYIKRHGAHSSNTIATEQETEQSSSIPSSTSQRKRGLGITTQGRTPTQTDSSQTQQTATRPKPGGLIEALAARRRAQAKERHKTDHVQDIVQSEASSEHSRRVDPDVVSGKQSNDVASSSMRAETAVGTTQSTTTSRKPVETDSNAAVAVAPATESTSHPRRERSSSQPIRANDPVHIEELDVKDSSDSSAEQPADSTQLSAASLPEENVMRQLADAVYLHGIDRT